MKQVLWYLPNGSGGMAALHRASRIKVALIDWAAHHMLDINVNKQLTAYSKNGLRYYALRFSDEHATLFALTWDNSVSQLHYEHIDDYIP